MNYRMAFFELIAKHNAFSNSGCIGQSRWIWSSMILSFLFDVRGQCTRSTLAASSGSKLAAQLASFTFIHKTDDFEVFKSDGSAPLYVEERGVSDYFETLLKNFYKIKNYASGANEGKRVWEVNIEDTLNVLQFADECSLLKYHRMYYCFKHVKRKSLPRPKENNIRFSEMKRVHLRFYFRPYCGFATQTRILENAKKLRQNLKARNVRYETNYVITSAIFRDSCTNAGGKPNKWNFVGYVRKSTEE